MKRKPSKAKFICLGWALLEHRYRYYILDAPIIDDEEYDGLEDKYARMAVRLSLPASATEMVGFDMSRPSCVRVALKVKQGRETLCRKLAIDPDYTIDKIMDTTGD